MADSVARLPLALRIAADPAHLATARSFAGSIARVLGATDVLRQDLRLAVSELITIAIVGGLNELTVTVEFPETPESRGSTAIFRISSTKSMPSVPAETAGMLGVMMPTTMWSESEPWTIRLIAAPADD